MYHDLTARDYLPAKAIKRVVAGVGPGGASPASRRPLDDLTRHQETNTWLAL